MILLRTSKYNNRTYCIPGNLDEVHSRNDLKRHIEKKI